MHMKVGVFEYPPTPYVSDVLLRSDRADLCYAFYIWI